MPYSAHDALMDDESRNPARRIEVVFTDFDRKVTVDLAEGHSDGAAQDMADQLVSVLVADDPDEAERALTAASGEQVTVRRLR